MVLMCILGGKGTIAGPVIGAVLIVAFNEFFVATLGASAINILRNRPDHGADADVLPAWTGWHLGQAPQASTHFELGLIYDPDALQRATIDLFTTRALRAPRQRAAV